MNFRSELAREWAPYGALSGSQLAHLERHYERLIHWNRALNLTRIQSLEETIRLHYCESLYLGFSLPPGVFTIADLGSGAGFPGIPIAVLRPECSVTLIESHRRKAVFLREASAGLSNTNVLEGRAEEMSERFDWVVSRAVAPREVLSVNLAPNVAILSTTKELADLPSPEKTFSIPWGARRVIVMFHVEQRARVKI